MIRKQLLRLMCITMAGLSLQAAATPKKAKPTAPKARISLVSQKAGNSLIDRQYKDQQVIDAMMEMLKLNEGKKMHFYRCSSDKVTVGYGTNVQANPGLLDDVAVYHRKKALTPVEKASFVARISSASSDELAQYSITEQDADLMARRFLRKIIPGVCTFLSDNQTKQTFFYDLPVCMQALSLDICYNLGETKFCVYKNFKAALQRGDYAGAMTECTVYTNKETKEVNIEREERKQRLYRIMQLVQQHIGLSNRDILDKLEENYLLETGKNKKSPYCQKELRSEKCLAIGEAEARKQQLRYNQQVLSQLQAIVKTPSM